MDNFYKLFITLFGIGAAVSFAKSLKSKKPWREVLSELIITGIFAVGAASVLVFYPNTPFIAVAGLAALGTILGINFFSDKLEKVFDKIADKFLTKG